MARGFYTKPEKYKPEDLNQTLEKFYIEIRRKDGKDYEPDSLIVMLAALTDIWSPEIILYR